MPELNFSPFYTAVRSGKLDLSMVFADAGDAELIVIRPREDNVFYIADPKGFAEITKPLSADKDTPAGRQRLAAFYDRAYAAPKDRIGEYLCRVLAIRSRCASVYLEPMQYSVRATVTPQDDVNGDGCGHLRDTVAADGEKS